MNRSPITSHVLDTSLGTPAAGIMIALEKLQDSGDWIELGRERTNSDGRVLALLPPDASIHAGVYRLSFATASYFSKSGRTSFYPQVEITFEVAEPSQHYHVPLLINPFGYTTYRGS